MSLTLTAETAVIDGTRSYAERSDMTLTIEQIASVRPVRRTYPSGRSEHCAAMSPEGCACFVSSNKEKRLLSLEGQQFHSDAGRFPTLQKHNCLKTHQTQNEE